MPLTIAANPLTRALNAFPRPRTQNPRSGRWPRFTEIYGGHTTMLHDPKCRFDYPLAPIRLHHADLFSLDCAGAPSLLSSHSPYISYDRRSLSNASEHHLKPTTNTTTKRACSSGREPDGRDQFLSRS
ncbi:unnamed protein product [Prunus brigantina]